MSYDLVTSRGVQTWRTMSDHFRHALQKFRYAGADVLLAQQDFELLPERLDLVVDLTPVDSHDW